ncbi:MAG TPA: hydantoinase/oxoprolinase [Verrucomicrobia bacterium]|nr:hydantoinase/oxoprolinase [Verrucomicrobiota bacterium]
MSLNETLDVTPLESPIDVIACGVLAADLKHIVHGRGVDIRLHFLPGGLHASPELLHVELQKMIDLVSQADPPASRIVIGYGVCGRGTVNLKARGIPLVIPRVHDCIALFLGSDAEYHRQFAAHPGTYYLSAGWVEEKGDGGPRRNMGSDASAHPLYTTYEQLSEAYGADNADYIQAFMQSWTRNYTRSAFIDTGIGKQKSRYADQAREMAGRFGWEYAHLAGTHDLLTEALTTTRTTEAILVVPPGAVTCYDAIRRRLDCSATVTATPRADGRVDGRSTLAGGGGEPCVCATMQRHGIGLGIDAGGTYTDAVLYDFDRQEVLCKAKALTTHWDYSKGIREALDGLDPVTLKRVSITALSTTVATNAIVENRGQTVGLLVMPPCGWQDPEGFRHAPLAVIRGQLEIDGTEIEPVDAVQVRAVCQDLIQRQGVTAFAVGGYAAHANPSHELQVKSIIRESTAMSVTCSHELSSALHYRVRAETAALNARIIPCLESLLTRVTDALDAKGVAGPVMVVRSDGSFMKLSAALERPLETMLSGPAASAAGAGWLAQTGDALVADIGGTTTDTATLCGGRVRMNPEGASIGGWQTHIRALDLQTVGLGGDSHVHFRDTRILIGPERVAPICWLSATRQGTGDALAWVESRAQSPGISSADMTLFTCSGKTIPAFLSDIEMKIVALLQARPYSLTELAVALQKPHPSMVPIKRLVSEHVVQRCGFTPTDALHAAGRLDLWDRAASIRAARILAVRFQQDAVDWVSQVLTLFERTLALEILKKKLSEQTPIKALDSQPLAQAMLDRILDQEVRGGFGLTVSFQHPVIGIGAPAACFVPDACLRINARAVIPPHADVANAVGAIIGSIAIRHDVRITPDEIGCMHLSGVPDAPVYKSIEAATANAHAWLHRHLEQLSVRAGCRVPAITISLCDRTAADADGNPVFLGRVLEGQAIGVPDL